MIKLAKNLNFCANAQEGAELILSYIKWHQKIQIVDLGWTFSKEFALNNSHILYLAGLL